MKTEAIARIAEQFTFAGDDFNGLGRALTNLTNLTGPRYKSRRLNRYRNINGKRYQLHATRGWKCIGRVAA